MAIIVAVFSCDVAESQEPAKTSAQNAIPAWTVQIQGFHPGYYYWPGYGQKPSDAKYFSTWEDFYKRDNEITGKTNTSTQSVSPASSQNATSASTQNATPAWVVQKQTFQPGYYYWPGYGQKPSDAQYFSTLDDFQKRNNEITGKTNTPPQNVSAAPPPNVRPVSPLPKSSTVQIHIPNALVIGLVILVLVVVIRLVSRADARNMHVPPKLREDSKQQTCPSGEIAAKCVDPKTIYDPDEHAVTELFVTAVEPEPNRNAQLILTNRSLLIFPDVKRQNQEKLFWKIRLADIVQAHINYGSAPSPRIIIVSKVCVCSPVSYGIQHQGILGSGWLEKNKPAIDRGEIFTAPQTRVRAIVMGKVPGETPGEWLANRRKERVTGYYCYRLPEGLFFDPPGHCFCFHLNGKKPEFAGIFFAQMVALRKENLDPPSYKSTDELRNTSPWLSNDEKLEFQWQGKAAPKGIYVSFLRGLLGLGGAFSRAENIRDPSGVLPKQSSALWIYLTNRRLIVEVAGTSEVETMDFPRDGVRALELDQTKGRLEICIDGPSTQWDRDNPQKKWPLGTGPSLNLPASRLAETGGWEGFLTGHWGRRFVEFDSSLPDVKNMVETLSAAFKRPPPPPIFQPR